MYFKESVLVFASYISIGTLDIRLKSIETPSNEEERTGVVFDFTALRDFYLITKYSIFYFQMT